MKTLSITLLAFLYTGFLQGAILQTVNGPFTADDGTNGGDGHLLIDTSTDTGDWMDTYNGGGTFYIGFDFVVNDNNAESGSGGFFGGINLYGSANANNERLLIGNGWNSLNYGLALGGTGGFDEESSTAYGVGDEVRLIAKVTIVDGGTTNDTIDLFIDQLSEGTPDASRTLEVDDFVEIRHRSGNGSGNSTLSNLIVSTDYATAIPEPSSIALVVLGLGGALFGFHGRLRK